MRDGIPAQDRTMVPVTSSRRPASRLFDDLEARFLANRDPHPHFALLGTFADADAAAMPGDDAILVAARRRVEELNTGTASIASSFSPGAALESWRGALMGCERKRQAHRVHRCVGPPIRVTSSAGGMSVLRSAAYVITLDSTRSSR